MHDLPENFELERVSSTLVAVKMMGDFDGDAIHILFDHIDQHIGDQPYGRSRSTSRSWAMPAHRPGVRVPSAST